MVNQTIAANKLRSYLSEFLEMSNKQISEAKQSGESMNSLLEKNGKSIKELKDYLLNKFNEEQHSKFVYLDTYKIENNN